MQDGELIYRFRKILDLMRDVGRRFLSDGWKEFELISPLFVQRFDYIYPNECTIIRNYTKEILSSKKYNSNDFNPKNNCWSKVSPIKYNTNHTITPTINKYSVLNVHSTLTTIPKSAPKSPRPKSTPILINALASQIEWYRGNETGLSIDSRFYRNEYSPKRY